MQNKSWSVALQGQRLICWWLFLCCISSVENKWKQAVFWEGESLLPSEIMGRER